MKPASTKALNLTPFITASTNAIPISAHNEYIPYAPWRCRVRGSAAG
ncbi:hypothetical protein P186_2040 [Pyrobaculum ferrireducens]|uniref:Uncharacterized protein n=1 Tax=Pyrobaculum ferrireducens TaxID=1104324 RepID=G7VIF6_9CREN|nr:hypothetical protein P186_2040 [Pyrobaculum ferrireducens]